MIYLKNAKPIPFKTFSGFDEFPEEIDELFWEKGKPFYLKHNNHVDSIVICLHGYTASPYETLPIAEECFKLNIDAVAPLYEGHGFSQLKIQKKAIHRIKMKRMLESTRFEIKKARELYKHVYIYGQSMGGSISLAMASERLVDAVATTAPALKLPFGTGISTFFLGWLNLNIKDIVYNDYFNLSYAFQNVKSGKELQKLALYARKMLTKIKCPVLTLHSHNDQTIDPIVPKWIENRVNGDVKTLWFDESDHTMPLDKKGKDVSLAIAKFFENV